MKVNFLVMDIKSGGEWKSILHRIVLRMMLLDVFDISISWFKFWVRLSMNCLTWTLSSRGDVCISWFKLWVRLSMGSRLAWTLTSCGDVCISWLKFRKLRDIFEISVSWLKIGGLSDTGSFLDVLEMCISWFKLCQSSLENSTVNRGGSSRKSCSFCCPVHGE